MSDFSELEAELRKPETPDMTTGREACLQCPRLLFFLNELEKHQQIKNQLQERFWSGRDTKEVVRNNKGLIDSDGAVRPYEKMIQIRQARLERMLKSADRAVQDDLSDIIDLTKFCNGALASVPLVRTENDGSSTEYTTVLCDSPTYSEEDRLDNGDTSIVRRKI